MLLYQKRDDTLDLFYVAFSKCVGYAGHVTPLPRCCSRLWIIGLYNLDRQTFLSNVNVKR
ncbi:hypothetical protein AALO_G00109170 [Alosa alosa]|uniref:Uncharacterized protein n=1 Tax=Alosa alosa TaxID=278164 RepID=A0AAV6GNG3_9TELE|nr:hypothetical protein AALO_G00109170 [Alosa alosa]